MNTASLRQKLDTLWAMLPTLGRRFDARPFRERLMITLAVVAASVMVIDRFWLDGAFKRFRSHQAEYSTGKINARPSPPRSTTLAQELRTLEQSKAQQVEEVRSACQTLSRLERQPARGGECPANAALASTTAAAQSMRQWPSWLQPLASSQCQSLGRSEVTLRAVQQATVAVPGAASAASMPQADTGARSTSLFRPWPMAPRDRDHP